MSRSRPGEVDENPRRYVGRHRAPFAGRSLIHRWSWPSVPRAAVLPPDKIMEPTREHPTLAIGS